MKRISHSSAYICICCEVIVMLVSVVDENFSKPGIKKQELKEI